MSRLLYAILAAACALPAATLDECEKHRHYGREPQAQTCYSALTSSPDPAIRAEGYWGLGNHTAANEQFKAAVARLPKDANNQIAHLKTRWGLLYLDHEQAADAADLFDEALEARKDYAPALLGLATVASDRFERRAVELAERALKADPKLVGAQELLARLALEDNNPKKAAEEADKAIAMSPEALDAMAVHAAIEYLEDRDGGVWIAKIAKINPVYGKAHGMIGHFYVINRRYDEGIAQFKKALELTPRLWAVRAEMGVNLMRLGREDEARQNLEAAFNAGYKGNTTVNSLRLMDSYKRYNTYKTPRTIIRLEKRESELLLPYMRSELERAIDTFEKKYRYKLTAPVQLELYPEHEDFAVRTMGMPGLGALGVTFGYSVAMDSPSARKPGSFHWASTLWHELSHVFTLAVTHHKIPRWFTEGLAVHEETAIHKDWGDRLDPEAIRAIKEKKLLPIAELDRGFIRPSYPSQVVVSYFQAGKICDWIEEKWGFDKLLAMIRTFDKRIATTDVVRQQLGIEPEEFDKQFLAWLDTKVGAQVRNFDEWRKQMKPLAENANRKQWDYVIAEGGKVRDLYPDYVEAGSAYELLAEAHQAKGDNKSAIAQLQKYSDQGGRNPETLKKLGDLQTAAGMKAEAAKTLHRINFIYPKDESLHRKLGTLYLDLADKQGAVREFEALVASNPGDQAGSRYLLARAYADANRIEEAKDQVLQALEAAPGYRPAQKLLLELNRTK
jgi:cellulose synthase operon protein C